MADTPTPDTLRICEEALARDGVDRASYLDAACRGHPTLRQAVDSLLAEASANTFLDVPAWSTSAPRLDPGERLGPYEITGPPMVGGMGAVYPARDTRLGRLVALKVIGGDRWAGPAARQRFHREARAIASLGHPHICALHDVGSARPEHAGSRVVDFLVMEYLEGQTLAQCLCPGSPGAPARPLSITEAIDIGIEIADALTAAHAAGVIHRDLKPSNIMLVARGSGAQGTRHAKLLDFGLAKLAASSGIATSTESAAAATLPGMVLGTVGYQSPEQARGQEVDARSDLFAFGAVLFEMLTGQPAFTRASAADTLAAVLDFFPAPPSALNPAVPTSLDAVVSRALEKDAALRYQSAADLLADLLRVRREVTGRSSSPSLGQRRPDRDRRMRSRRVAARVAGGAVVLLLLAVLGWSLLEILPRAADPNALPVLSSREVSRGPGLDTEPAIAPDGVTIAYVSEDGTSRDIWLTDVQGSSVQRWTTHPAVDRHPAWSADGTRLYFESDRNGAPGIYEAPRLNSELAVIVIPGGSEPAVSPDGTRLAFVVGTPARVAVAGLDGRGPALTVITGASGGLSEHGSPTWSPDGKQLCYWAWDGLWIVPASGGAPRHVTHGLADIHPAWSASGFIYFSSTRSGNWQLWRVRPDGSALAAVTSGLGTEQWPALSGDGRRLAFSSARAGRQVVIRSLASGGVERPAGGGGEQTLPSFSFDGRSVYMSMLASSRQRIWVQGLRAGVPEGAPRPLVLRFAGAEPHAVSQASESPDGRWVAFLGITGEERDVFVAPAAGGMAVNITHHAGRDMHPAWSPDGSRLAFSSERDGTMHIWLQAMRDGQAVGSARRLTLGLPEEQVPAWSRDGRYVAFVTMPSAGAREVGVVALSDRPVKPDLVTSGAKAHRVRWTPSGLLLVSGWQESGGAVTLRAVDPVRRTVVGSFSPIALGADTSSVLFDVSPDGTSLALVRGRSDGRIGVLEVTRGRF